jgi:hypothetical protein
MRADGINTPSRALPGRRTPVVAASVCKPSQREVLEIRLVSLTADRGARVLARRSRAETAPISVFGGGIRAVRVCSRSQHHDFDSDVPKAITLCAHRPYRESVCGVGVSCRRSDRTRTGGLSMCLAGEAVQVSALPTALLRIVGNRAVEPSWWKQGKRAFEPTRVSFMPSARCMCTQRIAEVGSMIERNPDELDPLKGTGCDPPETEMGCPGPFRGRTRVDLRQTGWILQIP